MEILFQTNPHTARCLVLACGNTLRSDDGVGRWLAEWAEEHFCHESGVRVVSSHQWTPEFSEDIAAARAVIFVDCSVATPPGFIELTPVAANTETAAITHHLTAPQLLALARTLFDSSPPDALLLTVGAGSIELGESFSDEVKAALPKASALLEGTIRRFLVSAADTKPTEPENVNRRLLIEGLLEPSLRTYLSEAVETTLGER